MFLYFDLGDVLLNFDHDRACRQMGKLAGVDPTVVKELIFDSGLELEFERGAFTSQEFYERFCDATDTRPDYKELAVAASDIFWVNLPMKVLLGQLAAARTPLGLLSNTNEDHWKFVSRGRYGLIPDAFEHVVLSFRVGHVKPAAEIFEYAAETAGVAPQEIFYLDDVAGHVEAARRVGFDAMQFTGNVDEVRTALRQRGFAFNG